MEIFELSSRFHFTDGIGLPVARHLSVTLAPSRITTSVDVNESSIFGGTAKLYLKKNGHKSWVWQRHISMFIIPKQQTKRHSSFKNINETKQMKTFSKINR